MTNTGNAPAITPRAQIALARCKEQIQWYEGHASRESALYRMFQTCSVVLGGLTPILILWTELPKPLQALPAALGAIAAGLVGFYNWQSNWVRFAGAAEALKSELVKYETRTSPLYELSVGEEAALNNFVERIEALGLAETIGWKTQQFSKLGNQSDSGQ